jgi:predicted nucleic-acid-binding protein
MAGAVDTNVLLRLLLDDDAAQARAARAFQRAHGSLFLSHAVLLEASWVLVSGYGFTRDKLAAVVEMLIDADGFVIQEPAVVQGALREFRSSRAGFADCLILATARSAAMLPLGTFDKQLAKLEGARRLGGKRTR